MNAGSRINARVCITNLISTADRWHRWHRTVHADQFDEILISYDTQNGIYTGDHCTATKSSIIWRLGFDIMMSKHNHKWSMLEKPKSYPSTRVSNCAGNVHGLSRSLFLVQNGLDVIPSHPRMRTSLPTAVCAATRWGQCSNKFKQG